MLKKTLCPQCKRQFYKHRDSALVEKCEEIWLNSPDKTINEVSSLLNKTYMQIRHARLNIQKNRKLRGVPMLPSPRPPGVNQHTKKTTTHFPSPEERAKRNTRC